MKIYEKNFFKVRVLKLGQVYMKEATTKHTVIFRTFRYVRKLTEAYMALPSI